MKCITFATKQRKDKECLLNKIQLKIDKTTSERMKGKSCTATNKIYTRSLQCVQYGLALEDCSEGSQNRRLRTVVDWSQTGLDQI